MKALLKTAVAVLTLILLISCAVSLPVSSAGKLSYEFKGDEKNKAGFAEGKITLSGVPSGKYKLYWADDEKALDGFYEIAELKANGSFSFKDHNAIPADATKIIACENGGKLVKTAAAVYNIPKNKQLKYKSKDKNYSFMN